ncbi:MAG: hypothetical protein F6J94_32340, partial [Moorea sp. SIO1F2]|uniref:effector-associated domain EAD1-containing protein n=1 Tax=Moorena sp. SIO1F2 TaxID=2607819 RepID=UPI0013BE1FFF
MNAGHTPGYPIKKIKEALCSAFTSKSELASMLENQFRINLEDVARGEDLNEIVDNLVLDFDGQKRLGKLIDKALNEKPDNDELKKLYYEKIKISSSLLTILFPLEDNIIKACCIALIILSSKGNNMV